MARHLYTFVTLRAIAHQCFCWENINKTITNGGANAHTHCFFDNMPDAQLLVILNLFTALGEMVWFLARPTAHHTAICAFTSLQQNTHIPQRQTT